MNSTYNMNTVGPSLNGGRRTSKNWISLNTAQVYKLK